MCRFQSLYPISFININDSKHVIFAYLKSLKKIIFAIIYSHPILAENANFITKNFATSKVCTDKDGIKYLHHS